LAAILRESLGDLAELRASRSLRAAVVLLFFIQFGNGATLPLLELYVRDLSPRMSWVPESTAALFSVPAAMNLLAMPLWGRHGDRSGPSRALMRCAWMSGILLALHAAVFGYEELIAARLLFGLALAGAGPLAFGVAGVEISEDRRGGAMGVVFSARALAIASSAMLGGALAGWLGIRGLFLCGGAAILIPFWAIARARAREARMGGPAAEVSRGIGDQ
jgi:DHA1 family multidrug resistance protein-like MFS transporter